MKNKSVSKLDAEKLHLSQSHEAEVLALLEGAKAVLEQRKFNETAQLIFNYCKNLIGATAGYVALLSKDGNQNEVLFLDSGGKECFVDPNLPMPIRGLRKTVYKYGKTIYNNSFAESKWVRFLPEGHMRLENVLFSPLLIKKNVVGLIGLANKPGGFTDNDIRLSTAFGELATVALMNSTMMESLEESEQRFRSVTQTASDAIININQDGNIIFWNSAATKVFGYLPEDIIGKPVTVIMPTRFRKVHLAGMKRIISTGESQLIGKTFETTGLHKDGHEFPVGISLSSWKVREETFFTGILRDISLQKEIEKELRLSRDKLETRVMERTTALSRVNEMLRSEIKERKKIENILERERQNLYSVLDELPASVHLLGPDHRIHFANRYFREHFGDPKHDPCYKLLHNRKTSCPGCNIKEIFRNKMPGESEELHADGCLYHVYNYPFTDSDGTSLILQLGIDITEQKEAEKALRASEQRFRILVSSISDTVFTLNKSRQIEEIYGNLPENIKISKDQYVGKTLQEIFSSKERTIHNQAIKKALNGEPVLYNWIFRVFNEDRYIQNALAPIYNSEGEVDGVVGVARDITDQKHLENQLIQTEKLLTVAEMSAMISHEFRNSLTSIRMILELQLESKNLSDSELKSLSVALSSITHMEKIVKQLLSFSSPMEMVFKIGEVNSIIEESLDFVNLQIIKHQIELIKKLDKRISSIEMDANNLKEALVNLLLNAIQAVTMKTSNEKNKKITVLSKEYLLPISLYDEIPVPLMHLTEKTNIRDGKKENLIFKGTKYVLIEIKDNGIGMRKEKLSKIFDPFFTTKAGGSGLGLSMVKKTVNAHGGIIKVKSKVNRGTTFSIYLPIKVMEKFHGAE